VMREARLGPDASRSRTVPGESPDTGFAEGRSDR